MATAQQANTTAAPISTIDPNQLPKTQNTTVQGLLGSIMSQDNPLMQQARTQSKQQMASRGLLNSSMAVGAGQQAAYNVALPIAQQDAQSANQNNQFNASNTISALQQNMQAQNAGNQFNANQSNAQSQFNVGQANDLLKTELEFANRKELGNIEASYKTLMQANQSAGELYQQTIKNIADIAKDPDMDSATKQSRINNQMSYLKTGMSLYEKLNNIQGLDELIRF